MKTARNAPTTIAPPSRSELLRVALARRNWSRARLGRAMEPPMSRQRVADVLRGRGNPQDAWWVRAAEALGIDPAELGVGR